MNDQFIRDVKSIYSNDIKNASLDIYKFNFESEKSINKEFCLGPAYFMVLDFRNNEIEFVSPEVKNVLGCDTEDFSLDLFLSLIHPDDQQDFLNKRTTIRDFYKKIPLKKMAKYKTSFNYRMLNKDGKYLKQLHQAVVLEHDDQNNILKILVILTDITKVFSDISSKLSFIGLDGEPSYYNVALRNFYCPNKEFFTAREKEIINCILNGLSSNEIAQKLMISKYTVETHRKNILLKTETNSTPELINKVFTESLI